MADDRRKQWYAHFLKFVVLFISALAVLSLFRAFFLFYFSKGIDAVNASSALPALWMGLRVDAKWLSLSLVPAYLILLLAYWKPFFYKYSTLFAGLGLTCMVLLDAVNFGFFSFYKTPISPLNRIKANPKALTLALLGVTSVLLLAFFIRGSIGKFPLRQEDFAVSKVQLINASVPNGAAALYEATKAWRNFQIKGEPSQALTKFGYSNIEEAKNDLAVRTNTSTQLSFRPNVVFAVMESMSGDIFNSHDSLVNNTLGALEDALKDAVVFRKSVSIENGTFPSLEGLLFDTPISPISQSIYGRKELSFSQVRAFKEAGYRTIFLTGCPEPWRQINDTFKFYGFEEIYGQAAIGEKFPNAEKSPWGIGDKWMFKFAEDLLKEAEGTGRP